MSFLGSLVRLLATDSSEEIQALHCRDGHSTVAGLIYWWFMVVVESIMF